MKKIVLMVCAIIFFTASCSNEDHEIDNSKSEKKGRFDNILTCPKKTLQIFSIVLNGLYAL